MFVGQLFEAVYPFLFGQCEQLFVFQILKEVPLVARRGLVLEVARDGPVDGDVGKGALAPARRDVEVVDETADRLFDLFER